jgi:hypothetical protein
MDPTAPSNVTGQGTPEVWDQFRIWQQRCTALRMELTAAGVVLGPDCFVSHDLAPAPVEIKVKAEQYCFERLQRYHLQLASRQSSQQNCTFLHNTITIENSSNLQIGTLQQNFAPSQPFSPGQPHHDYHSYHHSTGGQPLTRANPAFSQTYPAAMPAMPNHSWTPPSALSFASLKKEPVWLAPPAMPSSWAKAVHRPENAIEVQRLYAHVVSESRASGHPLSEKQLVDSFKTKYPLASPYISIFMRRTTGK